MPISGSRRLAVVVASVVGLGVLPAWSATTATAAPDDDPFTLLRGFEPVGAKVRVEPREFAATRVDLAALRAQLPEGDGTAVVEVPAPDGSLQRFRVQRTRTMEPELAAAHPEIATWSGVGVDDRRASIALDITPMGFHAFVREPGARADWYVDPAYDRRGTTAHLSYLSADLPAPDQRRAEGEVEAIRDTVEGAAASRTTAPGAPVERHSYRLALVSDPSYAAYFGTENVLAEKVTLINRVNQVYDNDLSTELVLIADTEKLNFDSVAEATGPDGPCGAAPCYRLADPGNPATEDDDVPGDLDFCSGLTLGQNRTVLGQLVGASNYDVGHIALGTDGGGVAYLGVVGGDYKGGGCTGLSKPTGDFFAVDYVAHEIGHQFGGNHTFNGAEWNCAGLNRAPSASVEPGSGSSVMGYAGICRQDNLQPHSDPYFSHMSQDEIGAVINETPYDNIEVQTVSLRGFGPGDSITLGFGEDEQTITYETYTSATLAAAITALTGRSVSIAEWGFDEFGLSPVPAPPSPEGFQVIFNEAPTVQGALPADTDIPSLTVTSTSAGVSGFVGETAKGGTSQNEGTQAAGDNRNPEVVAPPDRTIPMRTPFALTGSGSDLDGDSLVFLWEQTDIGGATGTRLASNVKRDGPLFRVFGDDADVTTEDSLTSPSPGINLADGSPTRVFPDMAQVLAGHTNALSGTCPPPTNPSTTQMEEPVLDCYSEFLPTEDYGDSAAGAEPVTPPVLNFRLTARDLFPTGGGNAYDAVALTVDKNAGPFLVTSQAAPGRTLTPGTTVPVTWEVNNTESLASKVRISLSTDGGRSFATVLAAATANDGAETVQLPDVTSSDARIKIEAVDNYFFDVNDASFALKPATAPPPVIPVPETTITSGPADGSVVLEKRQTITYASSVAPATFICEVDGERVRCDGSGLTRRFRSGTHRFTVAAVNAAGVADPSPATITFTVPRNYSTFARDGRWDVKERARAFDGNFLTSRRRGSELVTRLPVTEEIALVIGRIKGGGVVRVFLGKRRIGTVGFKGPTSFRTLRTITLDRPRKGKLRLVVAKAKPVRIEGVAVVTDVD